jgi:excisionase family DNA binding protein
MLYAKMVLTKLHYSENQVRERAITTYMAPKLITVAEAARLKGVTRTAVYTAIKEGRLSHTRILGHIGLREADVSAWKPREYAGRPGTKSGRPSGTPVSAETRDRISESQKRRWMQRKQGKT